MPVSLLPVSVSSEVGRLAVPLLRVSLMQLELGLVALDSSRLDAKGTKSLGVRRHHHHHG